ncbi:uncharacterized protein ACOB6Z_004085 [Ctenodactylus gundi]
MSRTTVRGALPGLRRGELVAKMPARCLGPSRLGRNVRRPWGRRGGATASRRRVARRRGRPSVWGTRLGSAERLRDCRRPRRRRRAAKAAGAAEAGAALETRGAAGVLEPARDPRAVWVHGTMCEPEVVGPAGSVWVTRPVEEADSRSPVGCERKGRPGASGHESILELWLKVRAMRAASGCGEGSRVELHPIPAEEPVERGVPGRASWVETSRDGVTGPWVRGQAQVFPQASGPPAALGLEPGCERAPSFCGQGQAGRVSPPVDSPGAVEEIGWGIRCKFLRL